MSILIKGAEMPTSCLSCPLQGGTADCRLTQKTYNWGLTERPSDCPLIEVPSHGDLIDRDVLRASFKESIDECHNWANEIPNETEMYARVSQALGTFVECSLRTKGMPTVIPADKDGET